MEENKTLIANPALVISLKSRKMVLNDTVVAKVILFSKISAKVIYQKGIDKEFLGFF